jgi:CheY-like chemotaxis protein
MQEETGEKILLVDDEESLRRTLGDYLAFRGYQVETAKNGEEALKRLRKFHPDLIILDMAMPGMGGVSFLRKIMDDAGKPRHPILVLTARSVMREFFDGVSIQGFVPKPSSEKDIVREVERILAESERVKKPEGGRGRKTVLLCEDDDKRIGDMLGTFRSAGYEAQVVTSGPDALQTAMSHAPDVIVLKEILTGMNGSKVAGLLSAMQATREIPVILYDSTRQLKDSPLFSQGTVSTVRRNVWSTDPYTILAAVNEVFAVEAPAQ